MAASLKCPFLSKFTLSEIFTNAKLILNSADKCPYMPILMRNLSDYKKPTATLQSHEKANQEIRNEQHQQQQASAATSTSSIKCPFFDNIKTSRLLVETKLDDAQDLIDFSKKKSPVNSDDNKNHHHRHHNKHHQTPHNEGNKHSSDPFGYEKFFNDKINIKKTDHSYRVFKRISRDTNTFPIAKEFDLNGKLKDMTVWCSNDYLGLGCHPYVKEQVISAVNAYGAGSGGTRNISGSTPMHVLLEQELAKLHQKEAALLFTSCYVANDTTLFTLAKMLPHCHIFSDHGNHASMIQGIRNSGVPKHVFRHNDYEHLEELLKKLPISQPKIVAFESVHSMDGSICNIEKMCDITHKYGGYAFVDEVHAVGLYGKNGAGVGERDNVLDKMDIITGTLGKAFGNVGGYIAGSANFVDMIRSYGSGFIFTTSLPPSVAAGALASLQISCSEEGRRLRALHQHNAAVLKHKLKSVGLPVMNNPSHIVPVLVGDAQKASDICNTLLNDYGIYIQSINYPTVARGLERLRIVPTPLHTQEMIDYLVDSLEQVWKSYELPLNKEALMSKNKKTDLSTCKTCKRELIGENWRNFCQTNKEICGGYVVAAN